MKRVKVTVLGKEYIVASDESDAYVVSLAEELELNVKELMANSNGLSMASALVLSCLNYMDALNKSLENAEHLRSQIKDYLEDAAKARIEADELRRENERKRREN